jgi:AraC family transcriptional regulator, ethanolamine operon transcriptional activator
MEIGHSHLVESTALAAFEAKTVHWAQLEPGTFVVRYGVVDAAPVEVSLRTFNLGLKVEADLTPQRSVVGIMAGSCIGARWFGAEIDQSSIAATHSFVNLSTDGPASFYQMSVDEAMLQRLFPDAPDALALLDNVQTVKLAQHPTYAKRLRICMDRLFSEGLPPAKTIYGTLIPLLANTMEGFDEHVIEPSKCHTRRLAAVRSCEAYMREHIGESVTLLDLSQMSGMRSRSLSNAFEAVTGFSPMDYLKRVRLTGVHRTLQLAGKTPTRIIDVATDWGFWHMGHFTADYRAMFGERPSETLLRSS